MLSKTDWALSEISVKDRPRPAKRKTSAGSVKKYFLFERSEFKGF